MGRRTIKVFLDSDVILSGLILDRGAPRLVLDILSLGLPSLRGMTGRYNLTEIERDIANNLAAAREVLGEFLTKSNLDVVFLPFRDELEPLRGIADDRDLPVLASVLIGRADFLVSDDRMLLSRLNEIGLDSTRPCRPDEFLKDILAGVLADGQCEDAKP